MNTPLTILSVSYPFAPVSLDAAGGAEQVIALLDRAYTAMGHRSIVIAPEGSQVSGTLVKTSLPAPPYDEMAMERTRRSYRPIIEEAIARYRVDVTHIHGYDFRLYLPSPGSPVLVSLHLPREFYPAEILPTPRPLTYLNAVSAAQHATFAKSSYLLSPVENGIDVDAFDTTHAKRRFALYLGRICEEKGTHLAMEAARKAGMPLLIAGQVFPYPPHLAYFENEVAPRLGPECRFIGRVGLTRKRRLLAAAQCLLVSSTVPETSSLVAREALASGTPVVAFRTGALVDAISEGKTGFLVESVDAMAQAITRTSQILPATCRTEARQRFSLEQMVEGYLNHFKLMMTAAQERSGVA